MNLPAVSWLKHRADKKEAGLNVCDQENRQAGRDRKIL